jgi:trimethylamine:corrinoid methyltransferase-like protein
VIKELGHGGNFLSSPHRVQWARKERDSPSAIIERATRVEFERRGKKDSFEKAGDVVTKILAERNPRTLPEEKKGLVRILKAGGKKYGLD